MNDDTTQLLELIEQMEDLFTHKGWLHVQELLTTQLASLRENLENADSPNVHVLQGQIRSLQYVVNLPLTVEYWRNSAEEQD